MKESKFCPDDTCDGTTKVLYVRGTKPATDKLSKPYLIYVKVGRMCMKCKLIVTPEMPYSG